MTNAQIIFNQSISLMEQGILKGSGQFVEVLDAEGNTQIMEAPEAIHTFNEWKRLGYKVKKGEHAVAKFEIWKPTSKKKQEEEEAPEGGQLKLQTPRMFKKMSAWFTAAQVEPIAAT